MLTILGIIIATILGITNDSADIPDFAVFMIFAFFLGGIGFQLDMLLGNLITIGGTVLFYLILILGGFFMLLYLYSNEKKNIQKRKMMNEEKNDSGGDKNGE